MADYPLSTSLELSRYYYEFLTTQTPRHLLVAFRKQKISGCFQRQLGAILKEKSAFVVNGNTDLEESKTRENEKKDK